MATLVAKPHLLLSEQGEYVIVYWQRILTPKDLTTLSSFLVMQPFSKRVPPFFKGTDIPATISMLVGQTELVPSGPNTLLICSQDLSLSLPPMIVLSNRKRGSSVGRSQTPTRDRSPSVERAVAPARARTASPGRRSHTPRTSTLLPPQSPHSTRGPLPYMKKRVTIKSPSVSSISDQSESAEESGNESDRDEDDEDEDDNSGKIEKPAGEPGRPGRGGYNLEAALGWGEKEYSQFKVSFCANLMQWSLFHALCRLKSTD